MKRSFFAFLVLCMAVCLVSAGPAIGADKTTFLTLGSGSPGGVYYPLGGGMSVVIQKTIDGIRCAAESTGASVENSRLVGSKESDMGMVMGSVAYKATQGMDPFKEKYPLVALFQMYPAPEHIVTTAQSGIKTFEDLKGKKISIDVPGSGCSTMAKAMMEAYGFDLEKDVKLADLSQTESVQALKDGIVDACFFNFAYPASAVMDLNATRDILLVPVSSKMADKIVKKYPYYLKTTIPGGTYDDVKEDVLCIGDSNVLVANKAMRADIAYKVVKAIYTNVQEGKYALINIHPIAAQLTPKNGVNSPIPLHPGAKKFFVEAGAYK
ncbi:MAG: TAXI family TRAP transporter solute-binding subunit [Deltaproteobacteria bacterium]|nr:TAXI family TRAP transporter solute-binding subunit [Deltaproteobacteria bacterium]